MSLLAAAIAGMPAQLLAQTTNNPAAAKKSAAAKKDSAAKKKAAHPFHGKLAAVDKTAKTIKVGESVYQITSDDEDHQGGQAGHPGRRRSRRAGQRLCQAGRGREDGRDDGALWGQG